MDTGLFYHESFNRYKTVIRPQGRPTKPNQDLPDAHKRHRPLQNKMSQTAHCLKAESESEKTLNQRKILRNVQVSESSENLVKNIPQKTTHVHSASRHVSTNQRAPESRPANQRALEYE
ncbi:hypothetical protein NQD34_010055 [Periophthalmus magnuspinnatus]|nr:hypothetical protein NQD34_010055 [Periophthalmus magnuspinnatus]